MAAPDPVDDPHDSHAHDRRSAGDLPTLVDPPTLIDQRGAGEGKGLLWAGVAVTAFGAGAAVLWVVVTILQKAVAYYEDHRWQVIAGSALVLLLVISGTAAVVAEKRRNRAIRARIRRVGHLHRIDQMTGPMFEEFVADLLRRDGYRAVETIGRSGDKGADVVARTPDGRRIAVQCKRQVRTVGADRIRNLVGAVHGAYSGHLGVLVTSSTFTRPAMAEAAGRLVLVDRDRLAAWMDGERLRL